jgi:hypothetical protein
MAEVINDDIDGNTQHERTTGKVTTQRPTRRGPAPQVSRWYRCRSGRFTNPTLFPLLSMPLDSK